MGRKGGPVPKPTALRLLDGDRADRINKREPEFRRAGKAPAAFADMSPAAKRVWRRLAHDLWRLGLLSPAFRDTFRGFCEAVATRNEAAVDLRVRGLVVESDRPDRPGLVTNPSWRIYRDSDNAVRRWATEFGLTPSAAGTIKVPDEQTEDDLAAFILGRTAGS